MKNIDASTTFPASSPKTDRRSVKVAPEGCLPNATVLRTSTLGSYHTNYRSGQWAERPTTTNSEGDRRSPEEFDTKLDYYIGESAPNSVRKPCHDNDMSLNVIISPFTFQNYMQYSIDRYTPAELFAPTKNSIRTRGLNSSMPMTDNEIKKYTVTELAELYEFYKSIPKKKSLTEITELYKPIIKNKSLKEITELYKPILKNKSSTSYNDRRFSVYDSLSIGGEDPLMQQTLKVASSNSSGDRVTGRVSSEGGFQPPLSNSSGGSATFEVSSEGGFQPPLSNSSGDRVTGRVSSEETTCSVCPLPPEKFTPLYCVIHDSMDDLPSLSKKTDSTRQGAERTELLSLKQATKTQTHITEDQPISLLTSKDTLSEHKPKKFMVQLNITFITRIYERYRRRKIVPEN